MGATGRQVDLQRIMSSGNRGPDRPRLGLTRRRLVLAAAVTAAAGTAAATGTSLLGPAPNPALAATPAPLAFKRPANAWPAEKILRDIAGRAEHSTDEPRGGEDEHLVIVSWDLWTQVDGKRVTSAVVPARRESWRGPDDSGRVVSSYETPIFRSKEDRKTWERDGSPGATAERQTTDFPTGQFPAIWKEQPPTDLASLTEWLARGHPTENGPAEAIVAITDLARERVLGPSTRANVLRVLATLPGLAYDGEVTDRAGRRGEAFSIESSFSGLPTRYTVIVEPATGHLLSYEQMLTQTAGKLNVRIPAVIGYEMYQKSNYADRPN
ncbi:CU044_5270 family protein [Micromonospora echinaurantiaca]|uniref:CU044_5270 family protein n=1 Tax=Micromonospora echinaurantiaca TaxID=47857 RepID=UPI0012FE25CE|nr:CU044_5270 family protein [Micromonospora echinaurantiaca]